jgi:hypothetical protein
LHFNGDFKPHSAPRSGLRTKRAQLPKQRR